MRLALAVALAALAVAGCAGPPPGVERFCVLVPSGRKVPDGSCQNAPADGTPAIDPGASRRWVVRWAYAVR